MARLPSKTMLAKITLRHSLCPILVLPTLPVLARLPALAPPQSTHPPFSCPTLRPSTTTTTQTHRLPSRPYYHLIIKFDPTLPSLLRSPHHPVPISLLPSPPPSNPCSHWYHHHPNLILAGTTTIQIIFSPPHLLSLSRSERQSSQPPHLISSLTLGLSGEGLWRGKRKWRG